MDRGHFRGTFWTNFWVLCGHLRDHLLAKTKLLGTFEPLFGHTWGTFWTTLKPRGETISIKLMVKIRKYCDNLHRKTRS